MDIALIKSKFARIGARAVIREPLWRSRYRREPETLAIDIARGGEYFDFRVPRGEEIDINVLDVQPAMRHLAFLD